jgi:membrane protein implicated in regulation of membrane protease activity
MELRNTTRLSRELFTKYQRAHFKIFVFPFICVLNLLIFILIFACAMDFSTSADCTGAAVRFALTAAVFGTATLAGMIWLILKIASAVALKRFTGEDTVYDFAFTDDRVEIKIKSAAGDGNVNVKYSAFVRAIVTDDLTALFPNAAVAYIMDCREIPAGVMAEFISVLRSTLGKKLRNRKRAA